MERNIALYLANDKSSYTPVAISITLSLYFRPESIGLMLIDGLVIMLSVCLSSYAFIDRTMGTKLMTLVKNKFQKR